MCRAGSPAESLGIWPSLAASPATLAPRGGPLVNGASAGLSPEDEPLFQHLRAVRAAIARAEGVPAYVVFPDRTLIEMAKTQPLDLDALRTIYGVGDRKLAAYGQAFVNAVAQFLGE